MFQRDFIAYALFVVFEIVRVTFQQNRLVLKSGKIRKSQSSKKDTDS